MTQTATGVPSISGGRMTWDEALVHLAGMDCLWQDLDGVHLESAPPAPPSTSVLWAWSGARMVRLRLDGGCVYLAACDGQSGDGKSGSSHTGAEVVSWSPGDGRVQSLRPPRNANVLAVHLEQVLVDGIAEGAGPLTFIRAHTDAGRSNGQRGGR